MALSAEGNPRDNKLQMKVIYKSNFFIATIKDSVK